MAQTTAHMSWQDAEVHVNGFGAGAAWTDITGQGASIAVGGGVRSHGEQNTMGDTDTPLVGHGKLSARTLTCRFVYTEEDTEAFEVVRALYEAHCGTMYVQYQVQTSGVWYKTGAAMCESLLMPGGDAGSGDVIMSEFVVVTASLDQASASDAGA